MKKPRLVWVLFLLVTSCPTEAQAPLFVPVKESSLLGGRQPADLALHDLNGDGHLDLLTANQGSDDFSVLLGQGNGQFRAAVGSPFAGGSAPHLIAAGELTGDNSPDVAITSHDSNGVLILEGNGQGSFKAAPRSPVETLADLSPHNHGLVLGDVNGDGHLDIVTSNQNHDLVSVVLADGEGGFVQSPGSPFAVGRRPYGAVLGDVNVDGRLDILSPNFASGDVTVLLGDGRGGFTTHPNAPQVGPGLYFVNVGDLTGDQRPDLVVTRDDTDWITILHGDGQGGFPQATRVNTRSRPWRVLLGDLNGDGRTDLAAGTGRSVEVLLNDGQGNFTQAPGSPYPSGQGSWGIALGDLNGDGKPDILVANSESGRATVLLAQ